MTSPPVPLATGFAPAAAADWLALVAKTLKGAGADSLVGRTADGLVVRPLYTAADAGAPLAFAARVPGPDAGWDVRAVIAPADPAEANAAALAALAGGAASLLIRVASDGRAGVAIGSEADLARVLDGVVTDLAPVALDAGFAGVATGQWLGRLAKASPAAPLAIHLDPLSAFAAAGASPGPMSGHLAAAAALGAGLADTYPKASLFLASGAVVHEAGGSPAWELAFALAAAVAYAKALAAAGLAIDAAFGRVVLGLAAEAQPVAAIAKLRAARVLWTRVTQACGVEVPARIEARSSGRMLTRADRWTNLVRLTSAGFAAAVGGADAVSLGAFTDAIGPADAFALRMARNTQLILMEEAHIGRVADPAGGAWAMEAQTADLARAAWDAFVAIEAAGGAAAALSAGVVSDAVTASRAALKGAIADRSLRIIGVTDFKSAEAAPDAAPAPAAAPSLSAPRPDGPDGACPALPAIRLEDLAQ